ncbi:MAG: YjfB family protein [Zoogloeaceae bacterium]|jgi:hypothetical protein|nr:YjfB family protein [Zoogloeaceae bacterium]
MEIGNVNVSALAAQASDAVGIYALKKAMDTQEQAAMQLISAIPAPANNPPHLGNGVDTRA